MPQKHPVEETPYRFRRRKPHTCCTSHTGKLKLIFETERAAKNYAKRRKAWGGDLTEPYECRVNKGKFHLRKPRL